MLDTLNVKIGFDFKITNTRFSMLTFLFVSLMTSHNDPSYRVFFKYKNNNVMKVIKDNKN